MCVHVNVYICVCLCLIISSGTACTLNCTVWRILDDLLAVAYGSFVICEGVFIDKFLMFALYVFCILYLIFWANKFSIKKPTAEIISHLQLVTQPTAVEVALVYNNAQFVSDWLWNQPYCPHWWWSTCLCRLGRIYSDWDLAHYLYITNLAFKH